MKRLRNFYLCFLLAAGFAVQPLSPVQAQDEPETIIECAFGYTSDDTVTPPFIDILTTGTLVDFTTGGTVPDDQVRGPFALGFSGRFFENSVTEFYVSTNGFIAFGEEPPAAASPSHIPADFAPNNMLAPFWDDLTVGGSYNSGAVYYRSFTGIGNPYLVVQWYRVTRYGSSNELNFEVIFYKNGKIRLIYGAMNGTLNEATVGIEDHDGVDGIENFYNALGLHSDMAIEYTYPSDGPRLKITPARQGNFFTNRAAVFELAVINTGTLPQAFNLELSAVAGVAFGTVAYFNPAGAALVDTTGDGLVDTGSLAPSASLPIRVVITQADGAVTGDYTHLELTARASSQPLKAFTAQLRAAVPAPFAQAYTGPDEGLQIQFVTPEDNFTRQAFGFFTGRSLTVAEADTHLYLYAWEHQFIKLVPGIPPNPDKYLAYANIEYTLVSTLTSRPMTVRVIQDNQDASDQYTIKDRAPVFKKALRTGRIGALFIQEEMNDSLQTRANVWFAVLDAQGEPIMSPAAHKVTDNDGWFKQGGTTGVPYYSAPNLTVVLNEATQKDVFILTWETRTMINFIDDINDIWMAVYSENGTQVLGATQLTNSDAEGSRFYNPVIVQTSGDEFLLAYTILDRFTQSYRIAYAVYNRSGALVVTEQIFEGSNGNGLDVSRLSDDRLLLAWTNNDSLRISYAVVEGATGMIIHDPTDLESPDMRAMSYVSVTYHDSLSGEHYGILTWGDDDWSQFLYYALVNEDGDLLTPPLAFRQGRDPADPVIFSSYTGGGNDHLVYPIPWGTYLPFIRRSN